MNSNILTTYYELIIAKGPLKNYLKKLIKIISKLFKQPNPRKMDKGLTKNTFFRRMSS